MHWNLEGYMSARSLLQSALQKFARDDFRLCISPPSFALRAIWSAASLPTAFLGVAHPTNLMHL